MGNNTGDNAAGLARPSALHMHSLFLLLFFAITTLLFTNRPLLAQEPALAQASISGPAGSRQFGGQVMALANGNFIVVDAAFATGSQTDVGAVFLYDGRTLQLISQLTGSHTNDHVGSGGILVLAHGNFVVLSPDWDRDTLADAGAATWVNDVTGLAGTVSVENSLVGSAVGDQVGWGGGCVLSNGNYVVLSNRWNEARGAATWSDGHAGVRGEISPLNSLVGATASDEVGAVCAPLTNGHYAIGSAYWANGPLAKAGAVTWGNGITGSSGIVTTGNSLVGSTAGDMVGVVVTPLANGNFVASTQFWNEGRGAATLVSGTASVSGIVGPTNSLVGSAPGDHVGLMIVPLTNGNYVVASPEWGNGALLAAGAATWGSGTVGVVGPVMMANSLYGVTAGDSICQQVTALSNGNYVVDSGRWDNGTTSDVGAVTWANGSTGRTGAVSTANSLVGNTHGDQIVVLAALSNGSYVVGGPTWDNGAIADAGAAMWVNGSAGASGTLTAAVSLHGSSPGDWVGQRVTALANGNYVVSSPRWDSPTFSNAGAATWGSGATGVVGPVSSTNSLVGSAAGDQAGLEGVLALTDGNYAVYSPNWDSGPVQNAGAVTWGNGSSGTRGEVSPVNSLVGNTAQDQVGMHAGALYIGKALPGGEYTVTSPSFNRDAIAGAGAVTWVGAGRAVTGTVEQPSSVIGAVANKGYLIVHAFSEPRQRLVVGLPGENRVAVIVRKWPLTVHRAGNGAGSVTSAPLGIDCGTACSVIVDAGDVVTLTATSGAQSSVAGWSGGCVGTGACVVTLDTASEVTATFRLPGYPLTVLLRGTGHGTVSGLPEDSSALLPGTVVTLVAMPEVGSVFAGWSGACLGTSSCAITMDAAKSVTATFDLQTFALIVNKAGTGEGEIDGLPREPGTMAYGTRVTLSARPNSGSTFAGWSGACVGTSSCAITMDAAKSVTAMFDLKGLDVVLSPTMAHGSVTVEVVSEATADATSLVHPYGSLLRFTARPDEGYIFESWAGDLTSRGAENPTQIELTQSITVDARFVEVRYHMYVPVLSRQDPGK